MEGFAALRAAQRAGVPAIELRGISNRCGDREASGWDFAAGLAGLQRVLGALFELRGVAIEECRMNPIRWRTRPVPTTPTSSPR